MPWVTRASVKARSPIPSSATVVPARSRQASVIGDSPSTHAPRLSSPARSRHLSAVGRRRLGPQVQLGPVLLKPAPNRESTEGDQRENNELLHDGNPFKPRLA